LNSCADFILLGLGYATLAVYEWVMGALKDQMECDGECDFPQAEWLELVYMVFRLIQKVCFRSFTWLGRYFWLRRFAIHPRPDSRGA